MAEDVAGSELLDLPAKLLATLRNAVDMAQMGRRVHVERSPYEVVVHDANYRLRRYELAEATSPDGTSSTAAAPLILVPPLMLTAEVYDVSPQVSGVRALSSLGVQPYVVDFGAPERQEGGLQRTLTDHIVAISDAVDYVAEESGRDVHLAGYSQGGIFVYLAAAYRCSRSLSSVITFGAPVNVHKGILPGLPDDLVLALVEPLGKAISAGLPGGAIPAWLSRNVFKMLSPSKELRHQIEFLGSLHDRDALMRKEGQRRFLADEGWVAWPGPAFSEFLEQMIVGNRLFSGGFVVEGRTVTLADLTCPVLAFAGENDDIARAHTVRSISDAAPNADLYEATLKAGHMGMVVGSTARQVTWPTVAAWIHWLDGNGKRPAGVVPLNERAAAGAEPPADAAAVSSGGPQAELSVEDLSHASARLARSTQSKKSDGKASQENAAASSSVEPEAAASGRTEAEAAVSARHGAGQAHADAVDNEDRASEEASEELQSLLGATAALGRDLFGLLVDIAGSGAEAAWTLGANVASQVPRIARLEALRRNSRVGLALTLAEQAAACPDDTFFLYEGRAHTYADADRRVDAIVKGLLSIGVRTGDHVGILMNSRPSALALVVAVNRLGAVSVLLRGKETLEQEIKLAQVDHLIADPNHAEAAIAAFAATVYVLGGVGNPERKVPDRAVDMDAIDPENVAVPEWYRPSPGKAEDVAFVFFAGEESQPRANRVTNRRWALSALGTASAVAMTPSDTVYGWTPIQHPTGLMVSMSAALAAGARLALAHGFNAATFWEDVRRYGATVVFYTGTLLHKLIDAPRSAAEHNHSLRMFAGSGMPLPLWEKILERFEPAGVLEFYATTEGNAILANVSGRKVGSIGRPLPGSAEVELAAWDLENDSPVLDAAGYVRKPMEGRPGMLIAKVEPEKGVVEGRPMRNVFKAGDAWHLSGTICRKDEDGDYWLIDRLADMIPASCGTIATPPIEEALWKVQGVSEVAAYALELPGPGITVPAAAVVPAAGAGLDSSALDLAVLSLPATSRPRVIRILDELPHTAGYRVRKQSLRRAGLDTQEAEAGRVLLLDEAGDSYSACDAAGLEEFASP